MNGGIPEPGQLARFDQAWAQINRHVDNMIATHRGVLAAGTSVREIHLAGLGQFLLANTDHEACAEMLACAIDRLLNAEGDQL